ncbi:aromatic compound degradation protein PaaI, partial [Streptomyces sp. NPDC057674]
MGRSRTVEWEDAGATARAAGTMAGLDFLREMVAGRLPGPPIAALLGFGLEEVEDGRAVFAFEPGEE